VWDNHGHASAWSVPTTWQMGLLAPADWHGANWIAYEQLPAERVTVLPVDSCKDTYTGNNVLPLLRKPFVARKPLRQATLYISGLGQFEAVLNGLRYPAKALSSRSTILLDYGDTMHAVINTNHDHSFGPENQEGFIN
jgi:hypothetical protein